MGFLLHIYYGDKKQEIDLDEKPSLSVGVAEKSDVVLAVFNLKADLKVATTNLGINIKSKNLIEIDGRQVKRGVLSVGGTCIVNRSPFVALTLYEKVKDSTKTIDFTKVSFVQIGRGHENNIILKNRKISEPHAQIEKQNTSIVLRDLDSTNGTYVNGTKVSETKLQDGDIISFAGYRLLFNNNMLFFRNVGNDLSLNVEEIRIPTVERGYPYFQRSPRMIHELPSGEIEIQTPPSMGAKPEINWLTVLLPPLAMVAVMGGVAYLMGSMASLMYTAPMALIGIIVSIANYSSQRKKHKKLEAARLHKYNSHLLEVQESLSMKAKSYAEAVNSASPSALECFSIVRNMERRLWERRPNDTDFLSLKIGKGELPFGVEIKTPKKNVSLDDDALLSEAEKLKEQYKTITNVPICVNAIEQPTIGIIGDRLGAIKVAKSMIVQAATNHSYEELKIVTLFNRSEAEEWSWIRWLPHAWDDSYAVRYLADSRSNSKDVLRLFEEDAKLRERELNEDDRRDKGIKLPFVLFVIADKALIENEGIMRFVAQNNTRLGMGAILLFNDIANLPGECSIIIEANRNDGVLRARDDAGKAVPFSIENIDPIELDTFARNMAPIRIKSVVAESKLPSCMTFLQGYNAKTPKELDIEKYWDEGLTYRSMAVPIGVMANGEPFMFDVHEKAHGPHGLVAGMTGSGKSEMVQSWILSMALHFSPSDVSFVLIDFKGTGLILPFMNMPHLAGTISNIDTNINRNLIALEKELTRRQLLFDRYGVQNITGYLKLYREGKADEPLSFLFVVIDEFAEFKAKFPDFMRAVDSIFATGRTLGVFTMLLTQKPANVVNDTMNANTRFRWCLKVASSTDSKEMIKHPDAAKITVPGRGYVQVGEDEIFELVQSYWSGAPYKPSARTTIVTSVKIRTVDLYGRRHKCESLEQTLGFESEVKEINAVVQHLDSYVKQRNVSRAQAIWMPKLKEILPIEEVLDESLGFNGQIWQTNPEDIAPAIGMVDDPYNQSQYPLKLNIAENGHVAIYGAPGTGKTTFLQTLAISLALSYSPDEVNIYAMDFGSWSLKALSALPHVGGVAADNEEEKVINLSKLILSILQERRQGFAAGGVNSLKAYAEAIGKPVPSVILLVDDFAPILELYPDLDDFFMTLTRSGSGYGIYLVATATAISGISYRISQNIKQSIALQMIDRTDYLSIIGRTDGLEPDKVLGRGLIKGKPPLEFQTATVIGKDEEFAAKAQALGEKLSEAWKGECAPSIPLMPDAVTKKDFPHIPDKSVPMGLTAGLNPIFFNSIHRVAIISGVEKSGKTNALLGLTDICFNSIDRQCYWFDLGGNFDWRDGINVLLDEKEIESALKELSEIAIERKENKHHEPPIIVAVDNLPLLLEHISSDGHKALEIIAENCKSANFYLYVTGNYNEIMLYFNQSDSLLQTILTSGVSIITGGKFSQHKFLSAGGLSYSELDAELPEFFGFYTAKGKTEKLKLILNT